MKYRALLPFSLVTSTYGAAGKGVGKAATALLAFTLCLAGAAPSAFGQSTCPQPAPTPATDPLHTIIPVHFDASTGNITVGSKTYCGKNPGFHLLALQRQPGLSHLDAPDMVSDQTYTDAGSVNSALKQILSTGGGPIVMVNAVGSYGIALNNVAQALTQFGAYPDLQVVNTAIPFIFIGNGGRNPQTALQRGYGTRNLDGYLAQDSNSNYTFTQTDFVRYDINPKDGSIIVGQNTYNVADSHRVNCDGRNAFHLLKVDREAPNAALVNNTYCTAQSDSEIQRLIADLNLITSNLTDEGALIFLVSNGHPIPANWNFGTDGDGRFYPLAQQVAKLGGYWETMVYLTPTDTYSLVGAAPPPSGTPERRPRAQESSSVYPVDVNGHSPTGELHGDLVRGRGNWYGPLNADTTGVANLGLYDILAQAPMSFPQFTGDQLTSYQNINQQLCANNNCIRNAYGNLNLDLAATFQTPLSNMRDPGSQKDCDDPGNAGLPFCQVRAQLLTEIRDAANVHKFYNNLFGLWSASGTVTLASQLGAYDMVRATLPAPPAAPAPSLAVPIVDLVLKLGSKIPEVGPVFGVADLFFNFATSFATDQQGNQTIDLTSTIGQLETQAANQFVAQGTGTGTLFESIIEDWGKLNALGTALASASGQTSPWYWSTTTTATILNNMMTPIQQAAYQNIMPAAYAIGSYLPQTPGNCILGPNAIWGQTPLWQQPRGYAVIDGSWKGCPLGISPVVMPFAPPADPVYIPYTYPSDSNNPYADDPTTGTILADGQWLGISSVNSPIDGGTRAGYDPPVAVLKTLFTPLSQSGGLGVYRPAFFEGWPFPRVACLPSYNVPGNGGHYVGTCNWSAAKPVAVSPGASGANITMQATQIASNATEVDVRLTIFNNGTTPANSVNLNSISLRTLAGSGQATVLSPNVPIQIGGLVAGDSTDVILKLNIPVGVTKLSITEQGSVDLGQSQLTQLSQGQVLYPQR